MCSASEHSCTETVQPCSVSVQLFLNEKFPSDVCALNRQKHMSRHKFILNDETKVNQFGFRVSNAGLDLDRFRANPVILDNHSNSNLSVIGRWENIQIEGNLLTAEAVFDDGDTYAKEIGRKVSEGFIKGSSLGLNP